MPELLGAVRSPINDAGGAKGMAHREGSGGELPVGGPSLSFSQANYDVDVIIAIHCTVISFCQLHVLSQNEN